MKSLLSLAFATLAITALAQENYPSRPITIVVPVVAGSGLELQARLVDGVLREKTGQPFVIEAKPGAGEIGRAHV